MQHIDYKKQTEEERQFRVRLRKTMAEAIGPRHGPIDVLRTALWVQELKARTGAHTLYQIERSIEPQAFGKNKNGESFHWNKWSYYQIGKHKPHKNLVDLADKKVPGSANVINHALWRALKFLPKASLNLGKELRRLGPDVQKVLLKENGSFNHDRAMVTQLRMLEWRAGLDSLAALVLLLWQANHNGDGKLAMLIGDSIYFVLLMMCTTYPYLAIANEIFQQFKVSIFPLVHDDSEIMYFEESFDFGENVIWLLILRLQLEDSYKIGLSHKKCIKAMRLLLDGHWGFDIKYMLAPHIVPIHPRSEETQSLYEWSDLRIRLREWGANVIRSGGHAKFPPDNI